MTANLIKTPIVDKNGKQTTVLKRADTATVSKQLGSIKPTVAKPAAKKRRAYKPTERQLEEMSFMVPRVTAHDSDWGNKINRETDTDLDAIPIDEGSSDYSSNHYCYRFKASEAQYYDVMSVVRPWDAINLMARGIKTSDEAKAFLSEHDLEYLSHGRSDIAEELMRAKVMANLSASYIDEIIDYGADAKNGVEWVKACSMKSMMYKAEAIKNEMLSGEITLADLQSIGIRNIASGIKPAAQHIIHSRNDQNPDFTVEDIADIMRHEANEIALEKELGFTTTPPEEQEARAGVRLNLARYHGRLAGMRGAFTFGPSYWLSKKMEDEGSSNYRELADFTRFVSQLDYSWYKGEEFSEALVDIFRSGMPAKKVSKYIEQADNAEEAVLMLQAAKRDVPLAVMDGWI